MRYGIVDNLSVATMPLPPNVAYRRALAGTLLVIDLTSQAIGQYKTTTKRRKELILLRNRADVLRRTLMPNDDDACYRAIQEMIDASKAIIDDSDVNM